MFKSIALLACAIAVVVAEPGYLGDAYALGHGYGYGGHGYSSYGHAVIPSAVSHQSNVAIHSKPIVHTIAAAPVVSVVKPHLVSAIPAATSHQSRVDVHSKPVIATTYTAHAPVAVATVPVVSKPIVSYTTPHLSHGSSFISGVSPIVSGLYGNGYHGLEGLSYGYGNGLSYGYGHGLSYGHGHDYYGSHY